MNGKVVLSMKNKNDLHRLLEVSPSSVRVVVMHDGPSAGHQLELAALRRELDVCRTRAEETDRSRHAYKTENVRLSHRVSYLEDQVSELIKCRSSAGSVAGSAAAANNNNNNGGGVLFQRGASAAMVRSKSPKHGVSAIQQYNKRKQQVVYDDCGRPAAARAAAAAAAAHEGGPVVKTRIRTVPRLYGSSASVDSLVSSADAVVAAKSFDDLHGAAMLQQQQHQLSPKRNKYPGGRNSSRTRHIREAQQTLFRFLDSESSGGGGGGVSYLLQQQQHSDVDGATSGGGGGSVRSLDLQHDADSLHRLKSTEYYSHLTSVAAAESPRLSRSLNYDSEQSGRRAPMPPKKPLRLSLQQRQQNKADADAVQTAAAAAADDAATNGSDGRRQHHHHHHHHRHHQHHHRRNDDVDLSAINNTLS